MNSAPIVESPPQAEQIPPVEDAPQTDATSIADHAKQFDPARRAEAAAEPVVAEKKSDDGISHHSEIQRRADDGTFDEGKRRVRNPVKRIQNLTGRAKTAEEQLAAANAEIARLRTPPQVQAQTPPQAPIAQSQASQPAAVPIPRAPADPRDPEPQATDAKFNGDYGLFLRAVTQWEARDQYRQIAFQDSLAKQAQGQAQEQETRKTFWKSRIDKVAEKYDDFEQVAFGTPTPWEKDSLVDAMIEKHDNGVELLYYLQSHPQERDSLLQMPEPKQVVALSLLLQRFESNGAGLTGATGSVASPNIRYLPPRPPNPVRTEAQQRVSGSSAPTDGSLSIAEHQKHFGPQPRRR